MASPSKSMIVKSILLIILVSAIVGGIGLYMKSERDKSERLKNEKSAQSFGVVNYELLLVEHPDYARLEELDAQVSQLEPDPLDPSKLKTINSDLSKKMMNYQKELEKLLQSEQNRIQQDVRAKISALESQMDGKARQKQMEFLNYKTQLENEYGKGQKGNKQPTAFEKKFEEKVRARAGDLIMLKDRQIAAKAMELSRKSQEKLFARKNSIEQQVSAYEEEIRQQNQPQKLDLRLKLEVAKSDEERAEVQKQLEEIFKDEQAKAEAKRKELSAEIKAIEDKEVAKNDAILKKYKATLDADVNRQLTSIQRKVAEELYKEGISKGTGDPFVPREIRDKLAARQKQIESEMKAMSNEMKSRAQALQSGAAQEFEARKNQIIGKLQTYQKGLAKEFDRKREEMIKEMKSSNTEKEKARNQLIEQRKKTFDLIVEDINKVACEIAGKKNIGVVIGSYVVNNNAVDLTEETKAVLQARKATAVPASIPGVSPAAPTVCPTPATGTESQGIPSPAATGSEAKPAQTPNAAEPGNAPGFRRDPNRNLSPWQPGQGGPDVRF